MTFEKQLKELKIRRKKALGMGGPEKLSKRKLDGILNARERINHLFDNNSFVEYGQLATSARNEVRDKTPADGKVSGFGNIDNRCVGVIANDFTVLGASSALINSKKIRHIKDIANKRGCPMIYLGESSGSRMPDRMGALGRTIICQDPTEYRRLREAPWVSALLGSCYGSSTWYACMSDFCVMRKGATMAVASSRVTSIAINQPVDPEELGGWKLLTSTSGLVDYAVDTDEEALDTIKKFLSYLPSNNMELPPIAATPDGSDEAIKKILDIVPEERAKTYDMRRVIEAIVDLDSMFEIKPRFGKAVVTALTRIKGQVTGIIGNNPKFKGGSLDTDACKKIMNAIVLFDSYNIPIVMLVDVPGFLIGIEGERKGAPGQIINWMNALTLVSVPKINIILRKAYGQAYINMGGGKNADENAVWPSADVGFMDPEIGVKVLYGIERKDNPKEFERRSKEIEQDSGAWGLAELYEAHEVLDPRETRQYLIDRLAIHRQRMSGGIGEHYLRTWPTSFV